jgi:undecaprenyl-diphosphatase
LKSIDKDIFLFLNGNHNSFLDEVMLNIGNVVFWIPVYLIAMFSFARFLNRRKNSYTYANCFLVLFFASAAFLIGWLLLPPAFEKFIVRIKPCYDPDISPFIHLFGDDCSSQFGFFAPRACVSFAISTFLFFAFYNSIRWIKYYLIFWALLVSYSRVYLGAHYPLNIVVSDFTGIIIGYLMYRMYFYVKDSMLVI